MERDTLFPAPIAHLYVSLSLVEGEGWIVRVTHKRLGESWGDGHVRTTSSARASVLMSFIEDELRSVLYNDLRSV